MYCHLLNTITPCSDAEAAQGRCSSSMHNVTEMDRLHEKHQLQCSPLRTPEEYVVIFMCVFETKTLKKFVFLAGVLYKTLQNCPCFFVISSVSVCPREQLEKRRTVF
jgi:hypothetical protein